jgi:hypothetical protein
MSDNDPRLPALVMYQQRNKRRFEPEVIVSQPTQRNRRAQSAREGGLGTLLEVPGLPIRFGRHLTAWVVWHTARVSLLSDSPSQGQFGGGADRSL